MPGGRRSADGPGAGAAGGIAPVTSPDAFCGSAAAGAGSARDTAGGGADVIGGANSEFRLAPGGAIEGAGDATGAIGCISTGDAGWVSGGTINTDGAGPPGTVPGRAITTGICAAP